MKKIELVKYEAPLVEVIEVEIEKGFATSNEDNSIKSLPIEEW